MKNQHDKNRSLKKDTVEDFELTDIDDEDLLVKDDDIIGFLSDSPAMVEHTDETLENGETETIHPEDADLIDAETIIAPSAFEDFEDSDTLTLDKDSESESDSEAHLKIGDVLDIDSQMIIGSEDGDETISGLEEELSESEETGSDTSERIIVAEKFEDMMPMPELKPEPDEISVVADDIIQEYQALKESAKEEEEAEVSEESDDEVLELGDDAIADSENEEDETIELIELAEEIDRDWSEIRDIDDIIGLGAEVLENTSELIAPIGFHPSEDDLSLTDQNETEAFPQAEKEIFGEEDSTDDVMSEVERILAAQEETQIAAMEDQTGISDNMRKTIDEDISEVTEKFSEEIKGYKLSDIFEEKPSDAEEETPDTDAATIIASPRELSEIRQPALQEDNLPDFDLDMEDRLFGEDYAEEEIPDTDAATIIAPRGELSEPRQSALQEDSLPDFDLDMEDRLFGEDDAEEEILDTDAATIIAPREELSEPRQSALQEDSLPDIDLDMEDKAEEEILDTDAATIIASPRDFSEIRHPGQEDNLLVDIDLEVQRLVRIAPDDDDIEDISVGDDDISDAATVIAIPEDVLSLSKTDLDIPEDDIFDLTPETIISQPESRDTTTQKVDSKSYQIIGRETDDQEIQDIQTVILPKEPEEYTETLRITPEPSPKPPIREKAVPEKENDDFTKEILKEIHQLPIKKPARTLPELMEKKELPLDIIVKTEEEPSPESDILEGEIFEEEEKDLLKFLEMDMTPTDIPEAKESDEEDQGLGEEDEYVPIEEVIKNPQEGDGTVIEEMIRGAAEYSESKGESQIYISITPEQMEAALERVIQKVFSEKIEHIVTQVIEKTFTEELEKKLRIILMQDDENRR